MKTQKHERINQELLTFLENSPTAFQAIAGMKETLSQKGYTALCESKRWKLEAGKGYYVTRNDSALIAFRIPKKDYKGFQIVTSHSDSPSFKIKFNPEIEVEGRYVKLNVEGYGGMLCAPWFDRPLSVAGRVVAEEDGAIVTKLINIEKDLLLIPNVAIHMNRKINDGYSYNIQIDMLPVIGEGSAKGRLMEMVAENAGVKKEAILGSDLFLYNRCKASIWGVDNAFMSSPRIDDLQCGFASLNAFTEVRDPKNVIVHCVFDNEEVGSGTKQGAASTFLKDTLTRVASGTGKSQEDYLRCLAGSFMVSADNGHALHPNFPGKTDDTNRTYMNGGVVIKYNANQHYTTDAVSEGIFKAICKKADVPWQTFVNRSDMAGGSTLGNIANTQTPMNTVDVGLAQLAMHSPYETAGTKDTEYMIKALKAFYETMVTTEGGGCYIV